MNKNGGGDLLNVGIMKIGLTKRMLDMAIITSDIKIDQCLDFSPILHYR